MGNQMLQVNDFLGINSVNIETTRINWKTGVHIAITNIWYRSDKTQMMAYHIIIYQALNFI